MAPLIELYAVGVRGKILKLRMRLGIDLRGMNFCEKMPQIYPLTFLRIAGGATSPKFKG